VKALLASGEVAPTLSAQGVASFLAQGAVREPLTAIAGVLALPAGHTATYRDGDLRIEPYWSPPRPLGEARDSGEAAAALRALLERAVERHMVSDAPIGVFLSGGVDSTLLATLAARQTRELRTLSVVFDDRELSEARYIDIAAVHAGGRHERIELDARKGAALLDDAFDAMDQPTFDGINAYVVARAAAGAGLKVALSGLGADELFDGYGHARRIRALERARRLPPMLRGAGALAAPLLARGSNDEKLRAWLRGNDGSAHALLRGLFMPEEVGQLMRTNSATTTIDAEMEDPALLDLTGYMRDVLLRDADAMGMAHSVEVRVPFLDDAIVEHVLALPASVRGERKSLLLAAAGDLLPKDITARKKQGFVLPTASWMRGELRDDVARTLESAEAVPMLDGSAVRDVWTRFERDGQRWLRPWALYALARWRRSLDPRVLKQNVTREVAA
jgi:asparagine synthase (glutamine-hydrolysing)